MFPIYRIAYIDLFHLVKLFPAAISMRNNFFVRGVPHISNRLYLFCISGEIFLPARRVRQPYRENLLPRKSDDPRPPAFVCSPDSKNQSIN